MNDSVIDTVVLTHVKKVSEDGERFKRRRAATRTLYGILWDREIRKQNDIYIYIYWGVFENIITFGTERERLIQSAQINFWRICLGQTGWYRVSKQIEKQFQKEKILI